MEVLKTIVFGLFLIGLALYLLAQLITPVGVIALIVVIVLICFGVAQGKRRGEERQQAEEERKAEAEMQRKRNAARERKARNARELADDRQAYGALADQFVRLISLAGELAEEVAHASVVVAGGDAEEIAAAAMVFCDISRILGTMSAANGRVPNQLVRFCNVVFQELAQDRCASREDAQSVLERFREQNSGVELPIVVTLLTAYDIAQGAQYGRMAASTYRDLVLMARNVCQASVAARMVADAYLGVLLPNIPGAEPVSSRAPSPLSCDRCRQFYVRLGIPADATRSEIKERHRDLCNVWHPDHFTHNEKLRVKATKEFQEMQQAFDHINSHLGATSSRSSN
jgi:uncharacterized membrane protein